MPCWSPQRTFDPVAHPVSQGSNDLCLNGKQIADFPIIKVGPEVAAGAGVDQLRVHLEPVSGLLLAAFQHIVHAEVLGDLADIGGTATVLEARILGDHGIGLAAREFGDHTLGDSIVQIAAVGTDAMILERQHGDDGHVVDVSCGPVNRPDVDPDDEDQYRHQRGRSDPCALAGLVAGVAEDGETTRR